MARRAQPTSPVVTHLETERTLDVDDAVPLPALGGGTVASVGAVVTHRLEATYFDTADLALAAARTTLRLRSGGSDDGWHLKLPVAQDQRMEVRLPPGRTRRTPPPALLPKVAAHVRGRELAPVVRLTTRRDEHPLLDGEGTVLAVVCDDHVQAERLGEEPTTSAWREWEVELVDGGPEALDEVTRRLVAAGARPSLHASKLARALGGDLPARRVLPTPSKQMSVGDLLVLTVAGHVADLVAADPRVRADENDAVHAMRVSTRRLRSLLATFGPLLSGDTGRHLREELKWLAAVLGQARDAEVLRERLSGLVAAEPAELVLGPVARRIDDALGRRYRDAHTAAVAVLDDTRYFALLDALDAWVAEPPLTEVALRPAREAVPALLNRDWKRLRSAAQAAQAAEPGTHQREEGLHDVRKAAKRLRYAADGATPVFRRRAPQLRALAQEVQTVLGEHNDAVVARDDLRRLGVQAHLAGENGFTFGLLHAREQARAEAAAARFWTLWADVEPPRTDRWAG